MTKDGKGLDPSPSSRLILTLEVGHQVISPEVCGPLPHGAVGQLLVHSSLTLKGLQVLPGVIDTDYREEIKVMVQSI